MFHKKDARLIWVYCSCCPIEWGSSYKFSSISLLCGCQQGKLWQSAHLLKLALSLVAGHCNIVNLICWLINILYSQVMIRQPVQYHGFSIPEPRILNIRQSVKKRLMIFNYYPKHSGQDRMASAISWILYSLAKHPEHNYLLSYIFRS